MVCITRICTGDVWVRSSTVPSSASGRVVGEQRVEAAARRMAARHVERLEVVEVGLDLGAFGDLEAEADEHVLEPLPRLGDEVRVAAPRTGDDLGEVEPLGGRAGRHARPGRARAPRGDRLGDRLGRRALSAWPAALRLVDGGERAEAGLQPRERALLAEQLGVDGRHLVDGGGGEDPGEAGVTCRGDVVEQRRSRSMSDMDIPFENHRTGQQGSPGPPSRCVRRCTRSTPGDTRGQRNRCTSRSRWLVVDMAHRLPRGPLPGHVEYQHRGRHRHVEALGPAGVRDRRASRRPGADASRPWASLPTTIAIGPAKSVSV